MTKSFKASAPGSLMLLGEYGVLHGEVALVCAIDKRISVTLTPNPSQDIAIYAAYGDYHTTLTELTIASPYQFVLAALKHYQAKMKRGCRLDITAHFSDQLGLGSSAAVTVATLAVLAAWLKIQLKSHDLLRQGRQVIRAVQQTGSGADVAASVYGGIVVYRAKPLSAEKISDTHPLTVWFSGYKTPTPEAIKIVQQQFVAYPYLYRELMRSIGQCAQEGIQVLRNKDWKKLGYLMSVQQGLMQSLGVCDEHMHAMVKTLQQHPAIKGAKISGSGLGDCIVGLGETSQPLYLADGGVQTITTAITLQGVSGEKI